ncbi:low molecular weight protein-tyrosine-phosphatase [Pseudomonas sp. GV071]|jgi:protein-tyrosine phosphatase|uniref:low molecular weight protein-tyrosine-phosphatase n=1 Tax=Pseudomonas sp. GV071 TaxID=2135754 RepID=UPI000D3AB0A4|nr:low molecular weight protein-tyrosine-phosphatase [Pseudomonas sp. GV071]PTQ69930.1 protein tyrosine phosphatase [Pseudomonas sp. GV071]
MRVLFVCLGNICRSPSAEGVFRQQLLQAGLDGLVEVDSAGTGPWHVGKPADSRASAAALQRGYDLSALRGRQVSKADFERFDLILAMDHSNFADLKALQPANSRAELDLYLRRYQLDEDEVPDPYYGGADGFEHVLDLLESAGAQLLNEVRGRL